MKTYEIIFNSVNYDTCVKPITILIIEPNEINTDTGVMLFTHGWGKNRFQHQDKMEYTVENFNLICISVEYRQSGYDYSYTIGAGASRPYDASFYQVFDVLNGLRTMLELHKKLNRDRLYHYGGSQGGHIALLSSIFAPETFAFIYASSPVTYLDETILTWTGREFSEDELMIRNVHQYVDKINCPVYIEHGTADTTVVCDKHGRALATKLKKAGKLANVIYYEGGEHDLSPVITKLEAFKAMAVEPMCHLKRNNKDDFILGSKIEIKCSSKTLRIDWSKPSDSVELFNFQGLML